MSWSTSELRVRLAPLNRLKPSSKIFYWPLQCGILLLWIFYVFVLSCVCYVFVRVCLNVLCGHLLGKSWPFGSRLWCLTVSLSLSHWYPGSGDVLDCIDSWSLHPYLLLLEIYRLKLKQIFFIVSIYMRHGYVETTWLQNTNMADTIENPINSGKTFFDSFVDIGQISLGFEADTSESWQQHAHCMRLTDKNLIKKLLTSNRKIRLLVNSFLTRSFS